MELPPMSVRAFWSFLFHTILLSSVEVPWLLGSAANFSNETDRLTLLDFKHLITDDPHRSMRSWNHTLHFCQWQGVTCGRQHPQRVTALNLTRQNLVGPISPFIANLTFLRRIHLEVNYFHGAIPQEIGKIPTELGSLLKLTELGLRKNNITGSIPPSLGNLSSLFVFYLTENSLEGSIPDELHRLVNLNFLLISENELSGTIPPSLFNLSSLYVLEVVENRLHGNFPPNLGLTLPNLQNLYAGGNHFTGPIPVSLPNASGLVIISLSGNSFSGSVPLNFGSLKGLSVLGLGGNELGIGKARDLGFLDSLTNCSSLRALDISRNHLSGELPDSIANLSTQLTILSFGTNRIFGSIPSAIQNLVSLTVLAMEDNLLTGTIPVGVVKLKKVGILSTLGNCKNLQFMYLDDNNFNSSLPKQVFSIISLIEVEAQNNFLTDMPYEAGDLKALGRLDVSNNKLSGKIPSWLGNCLSLEYLRLDGNFFQGSIPPAFSTLRGLQSLDLSRNNLSGKIPQYLENLSALKYLNLSFNNFEGELPKQGVFRNASEVSVLGNSKLCGGVPELQLPPCPSQVFKKRGMSLASKVKISIIVAVLCLISLSCFLTSLYWVRKSRRKSSAVPSVEDPFMNVSYAELFKATDGFSSSNLIGTGSFGCVYKGMLDRDGTLIAVKVLNLLQQGALGSFMAECEALRNIKHRNLIKVLTCCSSTDFKGNDFKALVFEYMLNGSLEKWLHKDEHDQVRRNLNFIERLNIAIDVAFVLDYLHHHCQTPIVHRDLKPNNILLDNDMT